ncbi:MAG: ABC transporter substrate-binding protein [Patescibacteria group bacterium]|nr:ABC transporter substrate-binding protein [Patescibacteria group bacterium]
MASLRKVLRYYYWLTIEFFKKHNKIFILSFLVSLIVFISIFSFSSVFSFENYRKNRIGLVGTYSLDNPPDEITNQISQGLISFDLQGRIIPILANHWEMKDGGKRYRFYLKDNLFWNDNKKFSAYEINYRFEDVETKVIDEKTIDFILKKPLEIFPIYLSKPIIKKPLVGVAGYYRVSKIRTSAGYLREVSLNSNLRNLPSFSYFFYQNENQLINAYKKGEITQMRVFKKSIADSFSDWKNTQIEKFVDYSKLLTLFFNFKNPYLNDRELRNALSMLIDVAKFSQFGEPARGPISPTSWAFNSRLKSYFYDLDTSRKIIEKEKVATLSSSLTLLTFYDNFETAEIILEEIRKVGLPVELRIGSIDQLKSFDFFLAFLKIPPDPDQYYYWHSTQEKSNIGGYRNPKVDLYLEKGRSTLLKEERKKHYLEFQEVLREDPPAIFLYFPFVYQIKRK